MKEIVIDGIEYVPKDSMLPLAPKVDGMELVMVRTYSAGVFFGYLEKRDGQEGTLRNARRVRYWEGAASLSQLATDGTSKPEKCKFPCAVDLVLLLQTIEIIPITNKAKESLEGVAIWQQ